MVVIYLRAFYEILLIGGSAFFKRNSSELMPDPVSNGFYIRCLYCGLSNLLYAGLNNEQCHANLV
jgi:hypothetical protein